MSKLENVSREPRAPVLEIYLVARFNEVSYMYEPYVRQPPGSLCYIAHNRYKHLKLYSNTYIRLSLYDVMKKLPYVMPINTIKELCVIDISL